MKSLARNWKLLFTVCLIFGLVGCADNKYTVERLQKASFSLGVAYAIQARNDIRYANCKTVGDVMDLAWLKYKEAN